MLPLDLVEFFNVAADVGALEGWNWGSMSPGAIIVNGGVLKANERMVPCAQYACRSTTCDRYTYEQKCR
jgi:hypothetical protein